MARPDPRLLGVLALVALVFARATSGEFVYDDLVLVVGNPKLADPTDLGAILGGPLYGAEQGYWRPLTSLLLAWGLALGGGGPTVLHIVALLLHLAVVWQSWSLARALGAGGGAAAVGALLFGLCPVVVEPVAWVAAINDPLWAMFALLALRAHLRWRDEGAVGLPAKAAGFFLLALASKETALSILPLLAAADIALRAPARPAWRALLRAYGVYAAVAATWIALRAIVLDSAGLAATGAAAIEPLDHPVVRRVEIAGRLLLRLLWPGEATPFAAPAADLSVGSSEVLLPFVAGLAWAGFTLIALWRRWQVPLFAALGFAAVALPVVAVPQAVGAHPIADRYVYVAASLAALALAHALGGLGRGRRAALAVLAVTALGLGAVSYGRIEVWSNQEALVSAGLEEHPRSARLHYMRGRLALEDFERSRRATDLADAEQLFERAFRLAHEPAWGGAALREPLLADIEVGLALCALARLAQAPTPRFGPVVERFAAIVDRHPDHGPAHLGLGVALASEGRMPEARRAFEKAIEVAPRLTQARVNLARVLIAEGDREGARRQLDAALALRPDDAQARAMREQLGR